MQKHLRNLTSLKKIAVSGDSYKTELSLHIIEYYYVEKFFAEANPEDIEEREAIWEQVHRNRMLTEANAYVHLMPQLEWLYFGQVPMGFTKLPGTQGELLLG